MKTLYSILDDPDALEELNASGVSLDQVKDILDIYERDVKRSPANFQFVGVENAKIRTIYAIREKIERHSAAPRSRKLKRIYGTLIRRIKSVTPQEGAQVNAELDTAAIAELSRKMEKVAPTKSESERREIVSRLAEVERAVLIKRSRRAKGYLLKHFLGSDQKEISQRSSGVSKQLPKKTFNP